FFARRRGQEPFIKGFAQCISICRWLKLIHKEWLVPLENAPFSKQWARKRCSVARRFRQYLRATNCYKLSDRSSPHLSCRTSPCLSAVQSTNWAITGSLTSFSGCSTRG